MRIKNNKDKTIKYRPKNFWQGQVYLVIIFELTIVAAVFFFLAFPVIEQAKGIVRLVDSYRALNNAESGLETALYNALKNPDNPLPNPDNEKIVFSIDPFNNVIESTGYAAFSERTIYYGR